MYDHDKQGSNISRFNTTNVEPGRYFPPDKPQYIEARNDGGCAFQSSTFTLTFQESGGREQLFDGTVAFTQSGSSYTYKNLERNITVVIDNNVNPSAITVTINNS